MEQHQVKIKSIQHITHDVLRIATEKPDGYVFTPGQATEISINKEGWKHENRPFTFTSLPGAVSLEFTTKTYPEREGVTNELLKLKPGDTLILHEVFGAISYKGEGVFIAGGAGVTPFIAIFRDLQSKNEIGNNRLIFANKRRKDIIMEQEFRGLLGDNFINILSDEKSDEYAHGYLTEEFLKPFINKTTQNVYVCGPPPMMEVMEKIFENLGVSKNTITVEI